MVSISASYNTKYFAVYALLSEIGVKCEIHDCTITLFEYLFIDSLPNELIKELRNSKENRVEAQYYTQEISVDLEQVVTQTKHFVLEIEKIVDALNSDKVSQLQKKLNVLTTK